jgi:hypothetical protein
MHIPWNNSQFGRVVVMYKYHHETFMTNHAQFRSIVVLGHGDPQSLAFREALSAVSRL